MNILTYSSWHVAVGLIVVLGAEEWPLMTNTLFTMSKKVNEFSLPVPLSFNRADLLAVVRGNINTVWSEKEPWEPEWRMIQPFSFIDYSLCGFPYNGN